MKHLFVFNEKHDVAIDQKIINKVGELMLRVIILNENAAPKTYYRFDFSGHTKQVNFDKRILPSCEAEYQFCCYLDRPDLRVSLEELETLIAAEEIKQRKERQDELI